MAGTHQGDPVAFSVRIFVPSGESAGLRIVEKSNWSGIGLVFPRSKLAEASARSELGGTGVYVLWADGGPTDDARAYVGESDILRNRLSNHATNKDFWGHAAVFTSKDQNLNKAHVRYLESRLVALARKAGRCTLENVTEPGQPSLSESDRADAELFLADMVLCLPVLGVPYFEVSRPSSKVSRSLSLSAKGVKAKGRQDLTEFVVYKGSCAVTTETPTIGSSNKRKRKALKAEGVLVAEGGHLRFVRDGRFSSPSQASSVVLGARSNGHTCWKDADGTLLGDIDAS